MTTAKHTRVSNRNLGVRFFTTTQIGRMLGASTRSVSNWIDSGRLQGYRLPGALDRRVTRQALVAFCHQERVPIPPDLLGDTEWRAVECLTGRQGSVRPFELGQLVGRGIIAGVLIGCHDGLDTATELAASIKVVSGQVRLALLLSEDRDVASVPGPARALFSAIFSSHEHLESLRWLASTIPTDPTDPAEEHNS